MPIGCAVYFDAATLQVLFDYRHVVRHEGQANECDLACGVAPIVRKYPAGAPRPNNAERQATQIYINTIIQHGKSTASLLDDVRAFRLRPVGYGDNAAHRAHAVGMLDFRDQRTCIFGVEDHARCTCHDPYTIGRQTGNAGSVFLVDKLEGLTRLTERNRRARRINRETHAAKKPQRRTRINRANLYSVIGPAHYSAIMFSRSVAAE